MSEQYKRRKYICQQAKYLSKDDSIDLGHLIVSNGHKNDLKEAPDGCRINLDNIDDSIVEQIFNVVKHKREKR
jgi:hypothetical protein